ncbi:hypothetical protein LguiB_015774 [Lonicera macranthoides]
MLTSSTNSTASPLFLLLLLLLLTNPGSILTLLSLILLGSSRKVRSNADLCNDLREFISAVGLPQGHVPSLKELSQHGRQDLANLVRRRGYKLIRELLSTTTNSNINSAKEGFTEKQDKASTTEDESTGQDDRVKDLAEDVYLSATTAITEDNSRSEFIDSNFNSDRKSSGSVEFSTDLSMKEKVANFISSGELDPIEESGFDALNRSVAEDSKQFTESQNPTELKTSFISKEKNDQVLSRTENGTLRSDYVSTKGLLSADSNEDPDLESRRQENQVEVNRLKLLLHQKELELSQLKLEIEKEKLALTTLQTRAETEISKAHKLILDKDAEMLTAEDSLSELEEVEIEYSGDGETVELAGSFNGWHHRIEMDPQPSSSITDAVGSRKSRVWRTVLWLYPGTYEIKFIVDGHWTIDPQRELVTKGAIHNNILRVTR